MYDMDEEYAPDVLATTVDTLKTRIVRAHIDLFVPIAPKNMGCNVKSRSNSELYFMDSMNPVHIFQENKVTSLFSLNTSCKKSWRWKKKKTCFFE